MGDDDSQKTVFVGGISWKADEENLRNFFSNYGKVLECKIIVDRVTSKSKGYGFVTFEEAETAERVKNATDLMFMGKMMNVGDAYRKDHKKSSTPLQTGSGFSQNFGGPVYPMYMQYGYSPYPYYAYPQQPQPQQQFYGQQFSGYPATLGTSQPFYGDVPQVPWNLDPSVSQPAVMEYMMLSEQQQQFYPNMIDGQLAYIEATDSQALEEKLSESQGNSKYPHYHPHHQSSGAQSSDGNSSTDGQTETKPGDPSRYNASAPDVV